MWQKLYRTKKLYWGRNPNPIFEKILPLIPKGKVLDLGAGEGRNSLYFAKSGFEAEAADKASEGLKKCRNLAKKHNLPVRTKVCDIRKFKFKKNKYSLVIASAVLDFLKKSDGERIIKKAKASLIQNGFIYLLVFTTKDPYHAKIKKIGLKELEQNTYYLPEHRTYRHFFTKKELRQMFSDFKIILLKQTRQKDTSHGKPHFHDFMQILARKKTMR